MSKRGRPTEQSKKEHNGNYTLGTDSIKYTYKNYRIVCVDVVDDPKDPLVKLEKLSIKLDKLREPVYINGRKKRTTKADKLEIEKTQAKYDELHYKLYPEDKPKRKYKKRK
jgi:hypothetical protein